MIWKVTDHTKMHSSMKTNSSPWQKMLPLWCGIITWLAGGWSPASAATTNVTIVNFGFSPANVTINVNDKVVWNWSSGGTPHSTTSMGSAAGLWDSGLHPTPFSFTNTFTQGGTFPYLCTLHTFMLGSVTVQSANTPPTVSLSAPANGATFAAPWTGTIQASAADADGTVVKVEFFAGATSLGVVNNPGPTPSITVTNLPGGNYTLTAVATDNGGATTTSAGVTITVVQPAPIMLSTVQRMSATAFKFSYSTTPGLTYIIQRSDGLPTFTPIATNSATLNTEPFQDNSATGALHFYRVRLAPNP